MAFFFWALKQDMLFPTSGPLYKSYLLPTMILPLPFDELLHPSSQIPACIALSANSSNLAAQIKSMPSALVDRTHHQLAGSFSFPCIEKRLGVMVKTGIERGGGVLLFGWGICLVVCFCFLYFSSCPVIRIDNLWVEWFGVIMQFEVCQRVTGVHGNKDQRLCGHHWAERSESQMHHLWKHYNDQKRWESKSGGPMLQAEGRQKGAMVSSGCGKGGASKYAGKNNITNGLEGS